MEHQTSIYRTGRRYVPALVVAVLLAGGAAAISGQAQDSSSGVTAFLDEVNDDLLRLATVASRAGWIQNTYITVDTEAMAAAANEKLIAAQTEYAKRAAQLANAPATPAERRQIDILRTSLTVAAPPNAKEAEELTRIMSGLEGAYGRGKYCPPGKTGDDCLDVEKITEIMAESRDPKRLEEVWNGWHAIGAPMRADYTRFVELSNSGARALGFADTGAMWRQKYDMPPEAFTRELDRLWDQLRPLYLSLHAYVRARLHEKYGAIVPERGPIPAQLLGNLWQQDWSNVYDIVAPPGGAPAFSLTDRLRAKKIEPLDMVRIGERFFTSLGFAPLPKTFWERSLFVKPRDREVVCHASAWDIDGVDNLRIKMCIDVTAEDFTTIHHELGHNFYQRAYNQQPFLFRDSANDGFHEAVGDTLALSVTPEYLKKIGLLDTVPPPSSDIGLLLREALDRLAFLPFGLMVDQWRWQVFDGTIAPDHYNQAWWDLKLRYQGVAPPSPRGEQFFDPGAKYHVPANTPYTRYFLSSVLQFQFHRALAKTAGCTEPLNRCSIYGSREAGQKLQAMLEMGASRPWPDALEVLTGHREMDASAMAEYFAPLKTWLDEQNKGRPVGW
jgi:peptidyl-dipeptidase A